MDKIKFITFLNSGCLEICLNMIKSANLVNIPNEDFHIYCLDENVYNALKNDYDCTFYDAASVSPIYQEWSMEANSGFRTVVRYKWRVIQDAYSKYKNVCWVDTDIAFRKDPRPIFNNFKEEVITQCDLPGNLICSGFMYFPNSDNAKNLIDECVSMGDEDDQNAINFIHQKYKVGILNRNLFPNGYAYYRENIKQDPYIVHNNCMVGVGVKIDHFKQEGLWFI